MSADFDAADIIAFVEHRLKPKVFPILAGHPPGFQAAVIADLTAIWLAGHFVHGDLAATRAMRAALWAEHMLAVEALVDINAAMMGTPFGDESVH